MNRLAACIAVLFIITLAQCSDNPTDDGGPLSGLPQSQLDSIASAFFQGIGDSLETISNIDFEEVKNVRFDDIRAGLEDVLRSDGNNPIAHLGLAILEILELNYDSEIWAVIDSVNQDRANPKIL